MTAADAMSASSPSEDRLGRRRDAFFQDWNGTCSSSSHPSRLTGALDSGLSQASSSRFELPPDHFLAQSTRKLSLGTSSRGERSCSISENGREPELVRESTRSLSSEEQEALSHIPSHVSQAFGEPGNDSSSRRHLRAARMPDTSTLAAADFDVDVRSGFLPPETPVSRLEGIEEEVWEVALDRALAIPLRIGGGGKNVTEVERQEARKWRRDVRHMLVLHPSPQTTSDVRYARRAHLVLSFLAHLYIHSQPIPLSKSTSSWRLAWPSRSPTDYDYQDEVVGKFTATVPAAIAVPWVAVSRQLDLPPILTYADSVLWNWGVKDPSLGCKVDNIFISTTFSQTPSEAHFLRTSLLIEKKGVLALTLMRRSLDEAFVGDSLARRRIAAYLRKLSTVVQELTQILHDVRSDCVPSTFFWGIRPWLNGGDSAVDKVTGEKGWIYEGVEEFEGKRKVYTGPSAGQSSLIFSLDLFLGVKHVKDGQDNSERENASFMEKMQLYMPGHHRNFLTHLKNISFVEQSSADEADEKLEMHPLRLLLINDNGKATEALRDAYNEVVTSLKHFRDEHMRIASLYIISQMRQPVPPEFSKLDPNLVTRQANTAATATTSKAEDAEAGAKGTGGTDLVSFLRDCRKNTIAALHR